MRLPTRRTTRTTSAARRGTFGEALTDTSAHAAGDCRRFTSPRRARAASDVPDSRQPRRDPRVRRNVVRDGSETPSRVEREHGRRFAVDDVAQTPSTRDATTASSGHALPEPVLQRRSGRHLRGACSDRMLRLPARPSRAPSRADRAQRRPRRRWTGTGRGSARPPWAEERLDGGPEEHRFVVGVRDHEQDVLPRARRIAAFATCETTRYTYIDQVCLRGERRGNANEVRREFTRGRSSNAPYALHCLRRTCTRTAAFKHAMPMNATSGVTPSHIAAASSFMVSCAASRTLCSWLLV